MGKEYKVAILPGDGIGPEVEAEGIKVLHCIGDIFSIKFQEEEFLWNSEYFLKHNRMYPETAFDTLKQFDAILLGAIGDPRVADSDSVRILLDIRKGFEQYVNLRPIKRYSGVPTYVVGLKNKNIDFTVIRENTEGEYSDVGGRVKVGTNDEIALQVNVFSYKGTERVMRYAFETAEARKKAGITQTSSVTNCTKSNALKYSMVAWDSIFERVAKNYPNVSTMKAMVDAITMWMIKNPENFDVVVASNLFGDIITDLGSILQGGMGFAAGGNINPDKTYPSMFEPIHGSAPKYTGKNVANPIATIMSVKMMLDHLGEIESGTLIDKAMEECLKNGLIKTRDMGGSMKTSEVGDIVCKKMLELAK